MLLGRLFYSKPHGAWKENKFIGLNVDRNRYNPFMWTTENLVFSNSEHSICYHYDANIFSWNLML